MFSSLSVSHARAALTVTGVFLIGKGTPSNGLVNAASVPITRYSLSPTAERELFGYGPQGTPLGPVAADTTP